MLSSEKLLRINELAKKSKTEGLSEAEVREQAELRQEYLKSFRSSFDKTLHSVKIVDPNGNDVTPEKLKKSQQASKNMKH